MCCLSQDTKEKAGRKLSLWCGRGDSRNEGLLRDPAQHHRAPHPLRRAGDGSEPAQQHHAAPLVATVAAKWVVLGSQTVECAGDSCVTRR
jgi:hypothetical protein